MGLVSVIAERLQGWTALSGSAALYCHLFLVLTVLKRIRIGGIFNVTTTASDSSETGLDSIF